MRDAINHMLQSNAAQTAMMRRKWKTHMERGMALHAAMEIWISIDGWSPVFDYYDRKRLRAAKIERLKKKLEHRVCILFPSWAVELLDHPECTKRMLTGAKRNLDYRAEKLMEVRWMKREQTKMPLLVHHTAVHDSFSPSAYPWHWRYQYLRNDS